LKKLDPEIDKTWKIWFGVGSLDLYPDDTAGLSGGGKGVLSGKITYTFLRMTLDRALPWG